MTTLSVFVSFPKHDYLKIYRQRKEEEQSFDYISDLSATQLHSYVYSGKMKDHSFKK